MNDEIGSPAPSAFFATRGGHKNTAGLGGRPAAFLWGVCVLEVLCCISAGMPLRSSASGGETRWRTKTLHEQPIFKGEGGPSRPLPSRQEKREIRDISRRGEAANIQ